MTVYIVIALTGLVVKFMVSIYVLRSSSVVESGMRTSLAIASVLFIGYSIPQVLLLAPDLWATSIGLERFQVLRIYYYYGTLCIISSIYLCLTLLNQQFHRSLWMLIILGGYTCIGGYAILATDWLVSSQYERLPFELELSSRGVSPAVLLTRLSVVVILTAILFSFVSTYKLTKSNQVQIASFYAIAAGLMFYLNCIAGLFFTHPFIFSIRGLFFFIALMLFANEKKKFDARGLAPTTYESRVLKRLESVFRDFANDEVGYRNAVKEIERELVDYKLNKISGFKRESGSTLPIVAENMKISLSSLYDLINRMKLRRPDS